MIDMKRALDQHDIACLRLRLVCANTEQPFVLSGSVREAPSPADKRNIWGQHGRRRLGNTRSAMAIAREPL
jgi:hypothetical protein